MRASYAAVWSHDQGEPHVGRPELDAYGLRFEDGSRHHGDKHFLALSEVSAVRRGESWERIRGLKTVVVEHRLGTNVKIAALGLGAAAELLALLAERPFA